MSIDLSLHRIAALVDRFDAYTRPTVHIAGTNGKGSVSAFLTSLFQHAGLTVGRFNSPHLLHPSDSIFLNGAPLSPILFSETMEEVQRKNEEYAIYASSFEVLTVCALLVFERSKVDVVLLEVGMGGRLDATNVISDRVILASVITAIDLDHQAFLGPTIEAIAREKAGIIRRGRPVVLAVQSHVNVQDIVSEVSKEMQAPLVLAPVANEREWDGEIDGEHSPSFSLHPFAPPSPRPVEVDLPLIQLQNKGEPEIQPGSELGKKSKYRALLPLHGAHQLGNLGAALTVLHVLRAQAISTSASASVSTSSFEPLPMPDLSSSTVYKCLAQMDERAIHAAVRECVWPGRLSFNLYHKSSSIPLKPSLSRPKATISESRANEENYQEPLVVLADGAHNEAAARKLSEYVYSLLSSLGTSHPISGEEGRRHRVRLTLVLALSHSPPKTPASVLVPLLTPFLVPSSDSTPTTSASTSLINAIEPSFTSNIPSHPFVPLHELIKLTTRIAFVRFSPPEGMPWVRPVPPAVLRDVVRASFLGADDVDFWEAPDSDTQEWDALRDLREALHWAAEKSPSKEERGVGGVGGGEGDNEGGKEDETKGENLVLIAGSLYLVADFYRLLQLQEPGRYVKEELHAEDLGRRRER